MKGARPSRHMFDLTKNNKGISAAEKFDTLRDLNLCEKVQKFAVELLGWVSRFGRDLLRTVDTSVVYIRYAR